MHSGQQPLIINDTVHKNIFSLAVQAEDALPFRLPT
jgi:hypothetical protein